MGNVATKVIPVITGAKGTISNSLRRYLSNKPGRHDVQELNKTTTLFAAHIMRKVLVYSTKGL